MTGRFGIARALRKAVDCGRGSPEAATGSPSWIGCRKRRKPARSCLRVDLALQQQWDRPASNEEACVSNPREDFLQGPGGWQTLRSTVYSAGRPALDTLLNPACPSASDSASKLARCKRFATSEGP